MSDSPSAGGFPWRRTLLVVVLATAVVLALLAGGLWLYTEQLYRTSYESGYSYDVAVNTNETLEDVTLYLPVPVEEGKPNLTAAMVEEGSAAEGNFSYRVVETEYGPMLELSADRVSVTPRYYEFVERNGTGERVEIPASEYDPSNPNMTREANAGTFATVTVAADDPVSTADPWGVEPMFAPRSNLRPTVCEFPVGDWLRCYEYDTRVYAAYETNETTRVDLAAFVEGQNAWWVFGWSYDYYRDGVRTELRGPQDGWRDATGTVEVDVDPRRPPSDRLTSPAAFAPVDAGTTNASAAAPASVG